MSKQNRNQNPSTSNQQQNNEQNKNQQNTQNKKNDQQYEVFRLGHAASRRAGHRRLTAGHACHGRGR